MIQYDKEKVANSLYVFLKHHPEIRIRAALDKPYDFERQAYSMLEMIKRYDFNNENTHDWQSQGEALVSKETIASFLDKHIVLSKGTNVRIKFRLHAGAEKVPYASFEMDNNTETFKFVVKDEDVFKEAGYAADADEKIKAEIQLLNTLLQGACESPKAKMVVTL